MIEAGLQEFFSNIPQFCNLIGGNCNFKFYPDLAPNDVSVPFVVYNNLHYTGGRNLSGDDGTREPTSGTGSSPRVRALFRSWPHSHL